MSTIFFDKNSSTSVMSLSIEEQNDETLQTVSVQVNNTPAQNSYQGLIDSQQLIATESANYNSFEIDSNDIAGAELISLVPTADSIARPIVNVVELPDSFVKASKMSARTRMWFEQQKSWCPSLKRVKGSRLEDASEGFENGAQGWPITTENMGNLLPVGNKLIATIKEPTEAFCISRSKLRPGQQVKSTIEKVGIVVPEDVPYQEIELGSFSYWPSPMYNNMVVPLLSDSNAGYSPTISFVSWMKSHLTTSSFSGDPRVGLYQIQVPIQTVTPSDVSVVHIGTQLMNGSLRDFWKLIINNNPLTGDNYIAVDVEEGRREYFRGHSLGSGSSIETFDTEVLHKDEGFFGVSYFSVTNGALVKRDRIKYKKYPWKYVNSVRSNPANSPEPVVINQTDNGSVIIRISKENMYLPKLDVPAWDTSTEQWRLAVKQKKLVRRVHVKMCNYRSGQKIDLGHFLLNGRIPAEGTEENDIEVVGLLENAVYMKLYDQFYELPQEADAYGILFNPWRELDTATFNNISSDATRRNWYWEIRFSEWTLGIEHALRTNERFMYSDNVNGQSIFRNTWSSEHPARIHKGRLGQPLESETLGSIIDESLSTYAYCGPAFSDAISDYSQTQLLATYSGGSQVQLPREKISHNWIQHGWFSIYGNVISGPGDTERIQDYYSVQPYYSFQLPIENLGATHPITAVRIRVKCSFSTGHEQSTARLFWPREWDFEDTNPFGTTDFQLVGHFHETPANGKFEVRDFVGYSHAMDHIQKVYVNQYGHEFLPIILENNNSSSRAEASSSKLSTHGYRQHFQNISELSLMLEHYMRERAVLTYRVEYSSDMSYEIIDFSVNMKTLEMPPQAPDNTSFFAGSSTADNFELGVWRTESFGTSTEAPFGAGISMTDKPLASVPQGYHFNEPNRWAQEIQEVQQYNPTIYSNYFIKF